MQKTSVYFPEELKQRLQKRSASSKQSEAELIRSAVDHYLNDLDNSNQVDTQTPVKPAVPGRLVGVGVGPGPANMVTVAALQALRRANRVVAPCTAIDAIGRAETIVRSAAPDVVVERMKFVMAPDHDARAQALASACDQVVDYLEAGDEVAFITLGDPNTYSTVSSVVAGVQARRPNTPVETVAGIMAFQALAAEGRIVLTDEQQSVVLLPASAPAEVIQDELTNSSRTVIFYKGGGRIETIASHLEKTGRLQNAMLGELLGMSGEQITAVADVRERPASYLSTIISPAPQGTGPTPPPSAELDSDSAIDSEIKAIMPKENR